MTGTDRLDELLASPPDGVVVDSVSNEIRIRTRGRPPQRVFQGDGCLVAVAIAAAAFAAVFGIVAVAIQLPDAWAGMWIFGSVFGPLLAFLTWLAWATLREIEIRIRPGEILIGSWRRQLREIRVARYSQFKVPGRRGRPEVQHGVSLLVEADEWRFIASEGQAVAEWIGAVVALRVAQAHEDREEAPAALTELVHRR